jgi:hypothetical protein
MLSCTKKKSRDDVQRHTPNRKLLLLKEAVRQIDGLLIRIYKHQRITCFKGALCSRSLPNYLCSPNCPMTSNVRQRGAVMPHACTQINVCCPHRVLSACLPVPQFTPISADRISPATPVIQNAAIATPIVRS